MATLGPALALEYMERRQQFCEKLSTCKSERWRWIFWCDRWPWEVPVDFSVSSPCVDGQEETRQPLE